MDINNLISFDNIDFFNHETRRILGKGALGKVYQVGLMIPPYTKLALKVIKVNRTNSLKQLLNEFEIQSQLIHPNIIKFYKWMYVDNKLYLFLEYGHNNNLYVCLKKKIIFSEKQKFLVFHQILKALDYTHNKGIIHRDMKPENIIIDMNLNAKLSDFGCSIQSSVENRRYTKCGTYQFMAPEIFKGEQQTTKTDIWSLGSIFYFVK